MGAVCRVQGRAVPRLKQRLRARPAKATCTRPSSAPQPLARQMASRWPARPKPVTSVMAWAEFRLCAAVWGLDRHAVQRIAHDIAIGRARHVGGKDHARAQRAGQDQRGRRAARRRCRWACGPRATRPVTVKPIVISAPCVVWPPMISAPASAMTSCAADMISASVRACSGPLIRGRIDVQRAPPAAPRPSPTHRPARECAAMRAISHGSAVKARRWSVLMTCTRPADLQGAGVVAGADQHVLAQAGARAGSAVLSASGPTLAPQPPQIIGWSDSSCAAPRAISRGSAGGGMVGRSRNFCMNAGRSGPSSARARAGEANAAAIGNGGLPAQRDQLEIMLLRLEPAGCGPPP